MEIDLLVQVEHPVPANALLETSNTLEVSNSSVGSQVTDIVHDSPQCVSCGLKFKQENTDSGSRCSECTKTKSNRRSLLAHISFLPIYRIMHQKTDPSRFERTSKKTKNQKVFFSANVFQRLHAHLFYHFSSRRPTSPKPKPRSDKKSKTKLGMHMWS